MNLMPEIAKMLGVEIGEAFKIKGNNSSIFKLEGTGLFSRKNTDDSIWCVTMGLTLRDIIVGVSEIEKLPFEPKSGQGYYKVVIRDGKLAAVAETWANWLADYADKYCGNCFRTAEEAEAFKYEIYEKLTGEKWKE